ncbi:hypothetical protein DBW_3612 [Desulfuromonas sp. DDH964]|uniref:hypothetical protein n=1 Tax=Desulfuromonas sp. DDH964 TaxID=1823759 RepID=UPI00078C903C|nr:hypothetical protein [Desulfuromonas sp. DDH964]AMV73910.1 hypothetical protein DBW_3612 [Desulfuromonas sp. DDH964]
MPSPTLHLPYGVRIWENELKGCPTPLREGYTFSLLENSCDSYRFTVVCNAERVAAIFNAFARTLPDEGFFILEYYEEEVDPGAENHPEPTVFYSPYFAPQPLAETLDRFFPRLVHDGFVGFGLANNRAGVELFYSEEKILTCFTGNHLRFINLLHALDILHVPELIFPTDLGHDHLSLLCHKRQSLPAPFSTMADHELDYVSFCGELVELLDMYPVEETLSFFLSKREQDEIEQCLARHAEFADFTEDDFGSLLLDWNDFVSECEEGFQGDLWDYRLGLKLRDMIQSVCEGTTPSLGAKLLGIVAEADSKFRRLLIDRRKRLDPPGDGQNLDDRFWYQGMVSNQGVSLRRDLIRQGWFKP